MSKTGSADLPHAIDRAISAAKEASAASARADLPQVAEAIGKIADAILRVADQALAVAARTGDSTADIRRVADAIAGRIAIVDRGVVIRDATAKLSGVSEAIAKAKVLAHETVAAGHPEAQGWHFDGLIERVARPLETAAHGAMGAAHCAKVMSAQPGAELWRIVKELAAAIAAANQTMVIEVARANRQRVAADEKATAALVAAAADAAANLDRIHEMIASANLQHLHEQITRSITAANNVVAGSSVADLDQVAQAIDAARAAAQQEVHVASAAVDFRRLAGAIRRFGKAIVAADEAVGSAGVLDFRHPAEVCAAVERDVAGAAGGDAARVAEAIRGIADAATTRYAGLWLCDVANQLTCAHQDVLAGIADADLEPLSRAITEALACAGHAVLRRGAEAITAEVRNRAERTSSQGWNRSDDDDDDDPIDDDQDLSALDDEYHGFDDPDSI